MIPAPNCQATPSSYVLPAETPGTVEHRQAVPFVSCANPDSESTSVTTWLDFGGGLLGSSSNQNSRATDFFLYSQAVENQWGSLRGSVMSSGFVLRGRTRGILCDVRRPAGQWPLCLRPRNRSSQVHLGFHLFLSLLVDVVSHTHLPLVP